MNTSASTIVTVNIPQNNLGFLNRGGRYLQIVKAVGPILVKIDSTDEKNFCRNRGYTSRTDLIGRHSAHRTDMPRRFAFGSGTMNLLTAALTRKKREVCR